MNEKKQKNDKKCETNIRTKQNRGTTQKHMNEEKTYERKGKQMNENKKYSKHI